MQRSRRARGPQPEGGRRRASISALPLLDDVTTSAASRALHLPGARAKVDLLFRDRPLEWRRLTLEAVSRVAVDVYGLMGTPRKL